MTILRAATLALALALLAGGCRVGAHRGPGGETKVAQRSLTEVLAAHTPRLMALPGVVGTYEGALEGGTPCITIMVSAMTPALRDSLPKTLEGWPVRIEVTGVIRPLDAGH
ncbi:MAG: hypothetical protein ACYDIE_09560 [Candidatus Krumholzibacteriia bacterium]